LLRKDVTRCRYVGSLANRLWQVADYQLLPLLLFDKSVLEEHPDQHLNRINDVTSVLLVISPLNSLINDQIQKLLATGLHMSALGVSNNQSSDDSEEIKCVTEQDKKEK
jgi:hypothetical protein